MIKVMRVISVITVFLFLSTAVFAEDSQMPTNQQIKPFDEADLLLGRREFQLLSVQQRFQTLSEHLSLEEREQLYSTHQVSGWWGLLNVVGAGSPVQGDLTGSILTIGTLVFGGLAANYGEYDYSYTHNSTSHTVYIIGVVLELGGLIYGQIRPWYYASEINTRMRTLLELPAR